MIFHPTNHPRIVFAGGQLFSEESASLFDGLLVFAEGMSGLHVTAWNAVHSGQVLCPYRIHGLDDAVGKVSFGRIPGTVQEDLDFLSAQGCRRIGVHAPDEMSRAKAALRATVEWLNAHPDAVDTLFFVDMQDDYHTCFGFESFGMDRGVFNPSPTDFEAYFEQEFPDRLSDIFGPAVEEDGYPYLSVERRDDIERHLSLFEPVNFSVSLFFTALVPQTVAKVTGQLQAMYDFLRVSRMPLLSRGLGGSMAPYTFLEYSGLLPVDAEWFHTARAEADYFYRVLTHHIIGGIRRPDSEPASRLARLDGGQIKAMRQELIQYISALESCRKEGAPLPNYYLPDGILRQGVR